MHNDKDHKFSWRPALGLIAIAALSAPTAAIAAPASQPSPPQAWVKTKVEAAKKLATKKVKAGTPEAEALKAEVRVLINEMLDWDEMTRRALGREWKKRTPTEQVEFSKILREMIEASYESKMRLAGKSKTKAPKKVKITWLEEEVRKDKGKVSASIKAGRTKAILEFSVIWKKGRWHVYDLAIDDVSTVRTYRSQFRKLIKDKGFDALLERMRAKAKEIKDGKGDLSSAMK